VVDELCLRVRVRLGLTLNPKSVSTFRSQLCVCNMSR
jgi:hypothetical protein